MVRSTPNQRPNPLGDITNTLFPTRYTSPASQKDDGSLGTDLNSTVGSTRETDDGSTTHQPPNPRHTYNGEFSFFLPNRDRSIHVAAADDAAGSANNDPHPNEDILYDEADVSLALIDSGLIGADDPVGDDRDNSDDESSSDISLCSSDDDNEAVITAPTADSSQISRRHGTYPTDRQSIRARAKECDWGNPKSILKWFPYWGDKSRYGRRAPPKEMLANLSPFAKAKAVCAWRRLSPNQQSATKAQFTIIAQQRREFESSLLKAEKAIEREEKKQQKQMERDILKRQKQIQKQKEKYNTEFDRAILKMSDKMDAYEEKLTRALAKIDDKMKEKEHKKRVREANRAVAKRARLEDETVSKYVCQY